MGENNHRDNHQESILEQISVTLIGLSGQMEQNSKDTRQIHEKQTQMGKRMEEENKNLIAEMEKSMDSVTQQEAKMSDGRRYDQTMVPQVAIVWGKKGYKGKRTPMIELRGRPTDFWANSERNTHTLTTART